MKKVFVNVLFVFVVLTINAQFDYRSGFIILNNNDTIYGQIDFKNDLSNSKHVYFKKDENSDVEEYFPNQLVAYRFINGKYYVSKQVKLSDKNKLVFLEVLLTGEVNVYYSVLYDNAEEVNKKKKGRYFVEKDDRLLEIDNDEIIITDKNGDKYFKNTNQYKGILRAIFTDHPEVANKVNYMAFNQKSLIKISKDYHEKSCPNEECIDFTKGLSKRKYALGVEYNYLLSKTDFYVLGSEPVISAKPASKISMGIMFAASIDNDYRIWLLSNLKYQHQVINNNNDLEDDYSTKREYEMSSILLELGFKYNLLVTKVKPFVKGTFAGGIITNENYLIDYGTHVVQENSEDEVVIYGFKASAGIEYQITSSLKTHITIDYFLNRTFIKLSESGFSISAGLAYEF